MRYIISFLTASLALLAGLALPASLALTFALPARAEVPRVVTDIAPVQSLVAQVMGDLGQPVLLLDAGADVHSFQLRPSQAADLADADLVIWMGPALTPWLDRAVQGGTAAQVRLLEAGGTHLRKYGQPEDEEDHEGHEEEDGHAGHEDHGDHDHAGTDPHAWLDPGNAALWLPLIAETLAARDPANTATYAANARSAMQELAALDAGLAALLRPLADRPFVVFHDAYGYFTAHYDLHPAMAIALGDAASPSAGQLHDLQTALTPGICVFPEVNHDPALTATVIGDTGATLGAALDPEGAALEPGPGLYPDLLRRLAQDIAACVAG